MWRSEVDEENLDTGRFELGRRHGLGWLDEAEGVAGTTIK